MNVFPHALLLIFRHESLEIPEAYLAHAEKRYSSMPSRLEFEQEAQIPPDRPTTYHKPYGIDVELDAIPEYPEPYDTWDNKGVA